MLAMSSFNFQPFLAADFRVHPSPKQTSLRRQLTLMDMERSRDRRSSEVQTLQPPKVLHSPVYFLSVSSPVLPRAPDANVKLSQVIADP